jgi:hypothetical protein
LLKTKINLSQNNINTSGKRTYLEADLSLDNIQSGTGRKIATHQSMSDSGGACAIVSRASGGSLTSNQCSSRINGFSGQTAMITSLATLKQQQPLKTISIPPQGQLGGSNQYSLFDSKYSPAAGNNFGFNAPNAAPPGTPGSANSFYNQPSGIGQKISNHQLMPDGGGGSVSTANSWSFAQYYHSGGS